MLLIRMFQRFAWKIFVLILGLTGFFRRANIDLIWLILGFLIMPMTTMWVAFVNVMWYGVWGCWAIVGLIVFIVLDLGGISSSKYSSSNTGDNK